LRARLPYRLRRPGAEARRLGQGNPTEGHIRLFTYRALRDFIDLKGFDVVHVTAT
jgi:hypothetical protein